MNKVFDVIVVGAGPAGATVAYHSALQGLGVLLLEKELLPRYKCCAGGVTVRAAGLLGFDISNIVQDTIAAARIDYNGRGRFSGTYKETVVYTVNRDEFDLEMVRRAESAGALCLQGVRVTDLRILPGMVEVVTTSGLFQGSYLVGADGAHGIVAARAGLRRELDYIVGINNEVETSPEELARWRSCIHADIGCIRAGYGWVFPKHDHLSIGIASLARSKARGLRRTYEEFTRKLGLKDITVLRHSGHIIPVIKRELPLYSGRIMLTGDAAGLADPLTGEGIYSAVLSGQMAARALTAALHKGASKLSRYQDDLASTILPELRIARVLRNLFARFPAAVFAVLKSEEMLWRGGCRLARGEIDYTFARQRIGGYKKMYAYLRRCFQ